MRSTELLQEAAVLIAAGLLKNDKVSRVLLSEVPHGTDGPPYYIGPKLRLLAVVSDKLAEEYHDRCANPLLVRYQDGDDNGSVWMDSRPEEREETAWHMLDTIEERFYSEHDIDLDPAGRLIDVILVPHMWAEGVEALIPLQLKFPDGTQQPLFNETELQHAIQHSRVFDPDTMEFVSHK